MYEITLKGSKGSCVYRAAGPLDYAERGARVKTMQLKLMLGDDVSIRIVPIKLVVAA